MREQATGARLARVAVAVAAALALGGCGANDCRKGTFRLTIDYAAAAGVDQLQISAAVEGGATLSGMFPAPAGGSGTAEIDFGKSYPTGKSVTVTVTALAAGAPIASVMRTLPAPATCGALTLTFGADAGGDMGGSTGAIQITPATATVKVGGKQAFSADIPVNWSVMEGDPGGTIDSGGTYTAPATAGTYHVVATSQADASVTGTATVTVDPYVLDVLAGKPGGQGSADGVGAAARFAGATGITSDGSGNLYITDQSANTVRRMDIATKTVTTVAGTPFVTGSADGVGAAASFKGPTGIAIYNGVAYVGDGNNATIRAINLTTRQVRTVAGAVGVSGTMDSAFGNGARFSWPQQLVSDGSGHIFIADWLNNHVRQLDVTNTNYAVSTLHDASNNPLAFNGPVGLAIDSGTLYVTEATTTVVSMVNLASPTTRTLLNAIGGTTANFVDDWGIAVTGSKVYVTPLHAGAALRFMALPSGSGSVGVLAGGNPAGQLDGQGSGAGFVGEGHPIPDGKGNLWVPDGCCLRLVNLSTGVVSTVAGALPSVAPTDGTGGAAAFLFPSSIAFDGADTVWVLDGPSSQRIIRRVDISTGQVTTLSTSASLGRVQAMTYNGKDALYLSLTDPDFVAWGLIKVATADGAVTTAVPQTNGPRWNAIAADNAGHVFVSVNHAISKIDLTGASPVTTTLAGTPGTAGTTDTKDGAPLFGTLQALSWDGAGTLYVGDDAAVRTVSIADGTTTTIAGAPASPGSGDGVGTAARFTAPGAMAVDGDSLYILDGSTVRRMSLSSAAVTTWIGIAGNPGVQPGPLPALLNRPRGIVSLGQGQLLLTDEYAVLRVH